MRKKDLLTPLKLCSMVMVLLMVMFSIMACTGPAGTAGTAGTAGPAGSAGPAGPAGAKGAPGAPAKLSGVSLTVEPPIQVAKRGNTVSLLGAGLKPKEKIRITLYKLNGLETDVTGICQSPVEVNENGAFEAILGSKIRVRNFPAGLYTVKITGRGEQTLATAPLKITTPAKK